MISKKDLLEYSVLRFNEYIKEYHSLDREQKIAQFNERLKDCKESIWRRKVQDQRMLDHEKLGQFTSRGKGLDMLCGDFLVKNAVGVDGMSRLGSMSGHVSDVCSLPQIPSSSQDFIVTNYFDGIRDPNVALNEWNRILKPGGSLSIITADAEQYEVSTAGPLHNFRRHHAYTIKTLQMYLVRNGFHIKQTELFDNRILVHAIKS